MDVEISDDQDLEYEIDGKYCTKQRIHKVSNVVHKKGGGCSTAVTKL